MKYLINITELHHGFVELEANNEDEAMEKAMDATDNGKVIWSNDESTEIWITSIKKLKSERNNHNETK